MCVCVCGVCVCAVYGCVFNSRPCDIEADDWLAAINESVLLAIDFMQMKITLDLWPLFLDSFEGKLGKLFS